MLDVTGILTAQMILHVTIDNVLILAPLETRAIQALSVKLSTMSLFVHVLMVTLVIYTLDANCVSSTEGIVNLTPIVRGLVNAKNNSLRHYF